VRGDASRCESRAALSTTMMFCGLPISVQYEPMLAAHASAIFGELWQDDDAWPFVASLIDAFTLDHCLWASDWPYLRASARVDYGVLLHLVLTLFPDTADRRKLLWDTPRELFGFAACLAES
jgi:predicted TIM-barrel fold metal-dependent hydrolase